MSFSLAINPRTQIKAAIKRASAHARLEMNALDSEVIDELFRLYEQAANDIDSQLAVYADDENNLRVESLRDIHQQVDQILKSLAQHRNNLMTHSMGQAAVLGTMPYRVATDAQTLVRVSDEALRFVRSFVADDGLQLSDRIWRLDAGAKRSITETIESAIIQGWGPSQAATDLLGRGMLGIINDGTRQALLTGTGSARYNAMRVMRTELNRAHGEAYMASGEDVEDIAGWRFLLSPRHPEADVCDMHARVNRYGLGPGVYPSRARCPWPAHPNTLSYVEIVFTDEITDEDRAGKTDRLQWLKTQPDDVQLAVLRAGPKQAALQRDLLRENEINTPWRDLKTRYEQRGIDITRLVPPPIKPLQLSGTLVLGIDPAELKGYIDAAWKNAPTSLRSIINNAPPVKTIRVVPSGTSYYQAGGITLTRTNMQKRAGSPSEHDVYRHEYGHFFDFHQGRQISITPNRDGGLLNSMDAARRSLHARSSAQKERRAWLNTEIDQRGDGYLADIFGALTLNKVGWGHSTSYLSRPGFPETEVFANLFNIYSRADRSAWRFLETELPDLAKDFKRFVEGF